MQKRSFALAYERLRDMSAATFPESNREDTIVS